MGNWEYEVVEGDPEAVRTELNRLGSLGWEIATTNVLATEPVRILVFLRRPVASDIPETTGVDLHDYPAFRPQT